MNCGKLLYLGTQKNDKSFETPQRVLYKPQNGHFQEKRMRQGLIYIKRIFSGEESNSRLSTFESAAI